MEERSKSENLRKLLVFARPYSTRLLGALLITVLLTMVGMVPPLIAMYIIDTVIVAGNWDLLEFLLLASIMLPLISAGLHVLNTYTISYISHRLIMDIRLLMYRHVFSLSMKFHDEMGTGKIMSRILDDLQWQGWQAPQVVPLYSEA